MAKRTSTPQLPVETVDIIMSRLSVKSLLRFKAVSKSWNTKISDPEFIRNHHHISKSDVEDLFLSKLAPKELLCLGKLEDTKLETVKTHQAPPDSVHALCFCDGVILFSINSHGRRYLLWDPIAGIETRFDIPFSVSPDTLGVCQDPNNGDFKVVAVSDGHFSVYSCENTSWSDAKRLNVVPRPPNMYYEPGPGVSVDGAIYWVWHRKGDNIIRGRYYGRLTHKKEITYYDPRNDEFKILQKPRDIRDYYETIYLVDLGGSLCLYCYRKDIQTVRIWKKEKGIDKNCWEVMIIIPNVDMPSWAFQPQCFFGNKIIFRNRNNRDLVVYSPLENKFEKFEGTRNYPYGLGLIPYRPAPTIRSTTLETKPKENISETQTLKTYSETSLGCFCNVNKIKKSVSPRFSIWKRVSELLLKGKQNLSSVM